MVSAKLYSNLVQTQAKLDNLVTNSNQNTDTLELYDVNYPTIDNFQWSNLASLIKYCYYTNHKFVLIGRYNTYYYPGETFKLNNLIGHIQTNNFMISDLTALSPSVRYEQNVNVGYFININSDNINYDSIQSYLKHCIMLNEFDFIVCDDCVPYDKIDSFMTKIKEITNNAKKYIYLHPAIATKLDDDLLNSDYAITYYTNTNLANPLSIADLLATIIESYLKTDQKLVLITSKNDHRLKSICNRLNYLLPLTIEYDEQHDLYQLFDQDIYLGQMLTYRDIDEILIDDQTIIIDDLDHRSFNDNDLSLLDLVDENNKLLVTSATLNTFKDFIKTISMSLKVPRLQEQLIKIDLNKPESLKTINLKI